MAASINASTSAGVVTTADTTGNLNLQSNGTTIVALTSAGEAVTGTLSASGNFAINSTQFTVNATTGAIAGKSMTLSGTTIPIITTMTNSDYAAAFSSNHGSVPYGIFVGYNAAAPNGTGSEAYSFSDNVAQRFLVRSNGGIANFSANNVNLSDEREKKNIELATSYLDKICAIPVKTFLFNDQTDDELNLGVIAQDVQKVAPELVMESNWAPKEQPEKLRYSIYQTDLQYALMKCIQEQQSLIESLTARIAALEPK
jgi:hypothetical protein